MKEKLDEITGNFPESTKKKIYWAIGAVIFVGIAGLFIDSQKKLEEKAAFKPATSIQGDIFSANSAKNTFQTEGIAAEINKVNQKVVETDEDLTKKVEQLTMLVEKLTEQTKMQNEAVENVMEDVQRKMQTKMAMVDNKLNVSVKRAEKRISNLDAKINQRPEPSSKKTVATKAHTRDINLDEEFAPVSLDDIEASAITSGDMPVATAQMPKVRIIQSGGKEKPVEQTNSSNSADAKTGAKQVTPVAGSQPTAVSDKSLLDQIFGPEEAPEKDDSEFIPASTLMSGFLMTGVDMPTSAVAKENPIPVSIHINSDALLPNGYRTGTVRGCRVLAQGYGDASTERVILRAHSINCIKEDGGAISVPLKATVLSAKDARPGIRGTLISRNGKLIENSMIAGTIGGLAQGLTPNPISAIGDGSSSSQVFQYANPADVLTFGGLSGSAKAANTIAEYYIKAAEETRPIISLSAGQAVDILLTDSVSLKTR